MIADHVVLVSALCIVCSVGNPVKYDYSKAVDFASLETPDQLAVNLNEDEFEDYLDFWLYQRSLNQIRRQGRMSTKQGGCIIPIKDLKEPLPIYADEYGLLKPYGNTGNVVISSSSLVKASCTGLNNGLHYSGIQAEEFDYGTLNCVSGKIFGSSWTPDVVDFTKVHCFHRTNFTTVESPLECPGGGIYINSTLIVNTQTHSVLTSCFDPVRSNVLYVEYEQKPEHVHTQSPVTRPQFSQGLHFPHLNVDDLYKQEEQKKTFDEILGPSMNKVYINSSYFLSRGHLAARTDFVFAPEQRATFTFVNAAPQWQPFNSRNWNVLEQNLRSRIATAGYHAKIYTGTWGILQLLDINGNYQDIYLHPSTKQIPVPMWYYKLVYEPSLQKGVVFLGLNNPYVTIEEAKTLAFCENICENNPDYSWIRWEANNIGRGFSICCTIEDFSKTVTYMPEFKLTGILS